MTVDRRTLDALVSVFAGFLLAFLAALAFVDAWHDSLSYRQFAVGVPFVRHPELRWAVAAEMIAVLFLLRFSRARSIEGKTKRFFIALVLANALAFLIAIPFVHLIGALAV